MSRPGDLSFRLLDELHASGCTEDRISTRCWPVIVPSWGDEEPTYLGNNRGAEIKVVYLEWCIDCGAADWEVV